MSESLFEGPYPEYVMPGVRIVRATREPCMICGHPTGDCAEGADVPHTIIGLGIRELEKRPEPTVLVPEDIFAERQITPFTRARVLIAAKGTYVSADKAKELGIL